MVYVWLDNWWRSGHRTPNATRYPSPSYTERSAALLALSFVEGSLSKCRGVEDGDTREFVVEVLEI